MNKIVKSHRGIYYVEVENKIILCKARGLFRNQNIKPLVGDNVEATLNSDGTGYIEKIYKRKNQLLRPEVANIDQVIVITSLKTPTINLNLLDKYLLMLELSKVDIKILFNKIDLVNKTALMEVSKIYSDIGYEIYLNSNKENTNDKLFELFENKITSVAGPSGVGKSTTLNKIFREFNLNTGAISEKTQRGKHTTRNIEIKKINKDSYVIDTPGFSSLSLDFIKEKAEIKNNFKEFLKYNSKCKFANCFHLNEPICGVKKALEELKISRGRYENYKSFLTEYDKTRRF